MTISTINVYFYHNRFVMGNEKWLSLELFGIILKITHWNYRSFPFRKVNSPYNVFSMQIKLNKENNLKTFVVSEMILFFLKKLLKVSKE